MACGSGGRAVAAAQGGGVGGEIESFPHLFPCRFDEFFSTLGTLESMW